ANGDIDCFKQTLKKGERLSVEVESVRLASNLSDLKLQISGPGGELVASVDDTPLARQDPYVTLIAPADGEYVITLEPSGSDGNDNTRYALHLGHFPRPDFVFPPGGRAGQPVTVQLCGDNTVEWEDRVKFDQTGTVSLYPAHDGLTSPTP